MSVENTGNGPLEWTMERHLPRDADVAPWVHRESIMVGDTIGNSRLNGVVFGNDHFFVSGRRIDDDSLHQIYVLSKDGELIRSFDQPDVGDRFGMRDLAWDKHNSILWGAVEQVVYGYSADGEQVARFEVDLGGRSGIQAIVWDEINELIWVAATVSDIFGFTVEGEHQATLNRRGLRIYGLAYWPDAPDDYKLYDLYQSTDGPSQVYKFNTATGDTTLVKTLLHPDGLAIDNGGIFATNQFDVYSWVFMHLADAATGDRIDIWQLDARRDWFKLYFGEDEEADSGRIDASQSTDFVLKLNSVDLPQDVVFESMLEFYHNAVPFMDIIDVSLDVIGARPPEVFNLLEPADWDTINPVFDDSITFVWELSNDPNVEEEVFYELWLEADGDSGYIDIATDQSEYAGELTALSEDIGFGLDVDIPVSWWVRAISGEDTTESADRFNLQFMPNFIEGKAGTPVEYGLHSIYPTPFNSMTTVRFGVDMAERIVLKVYDLQGREVETLYDRTPEVGYHKIAWNATSMASGLYIIRMESTSRVRTAKVALVR